ncbi:MFS transporter [bacterium]|nr:MAG: MFS transporter [bacterium]
MPMPSPGMTAMRYCFTYVLLDERWAFSYSRRRDLLRETEKATRRRGCAPSAPNAGPLRYLFLWLAGVDLRLTLLALPPILPMVRADLHLNEKAVAALTGLPVLLLAAAAIPGSMLIARLGARRALIIGLLAVALSSGLRGVGPSTTLLFAMTFFMGMGIAVVQPAVPTLINEWLSRSVGLATAVYTNGLLVGEALSAALTIPLVLPLVGGNWELSLVWWAVPVMLSTGAIARWAPPLVDHVAANGIRSWMPDWRDPSTWVLGMVQGGGSSVYFAANAFIPGYLHATGHAGLVGPCLTALNVGQLPATVVVAVAARQLIGRRVPLVAAGVLSAVALAIFLSGSTLGLVIGAAMFGFCAAVILILTLALPPLLAPAGGVHRLSAGMFTIGYAYAFLLPMIGGAAWDASGLPVSAFTPVALGALTVVIAGSAHRLLPRTVRPA